MSINIYPTPTTSSSPNGAGSLIVRGIANKSGFTYTSSTISSGMKLIYANPFDIGKYFVANAPNSGQVIVFPGQNYSTINLTTSETRFSVAEITSGNIGFGVNTGLGYGVGYTTASGANWVLGNGASRAQIIASTDLSTWTTRFNFASGSMNGRSAGIVIGNGRYIASPGVQNAGFAFSTDGVNWASRATFQTVTNSLMTFSGTHFGVVGLAGATSYFTISTDGLNWTSSALTGPDGSPTMMAGGGGYFGLTNGAPGTTTGDKVWFGQTSLSTVSVPGPSTSTGGYNAIAYGNGIWMVAGRDASHLPCIAMTTNRSTWTLAYPFGTGTAGSDNAAVRFGNGVFMVNWIGTNVQQGTKFLSKDGLSWTTSSLPKTDGSGNNALYHQPVTNGERMIYTLSRESSTAGVYVGGSATYYELYNASTDVIN